MKTEAWKMKICPKCKGNELIGNWCEKCEIDLGSKVKIIKVRRV